MEVRAAAVEAVATGEGGVNVATAEEAAEGEAEAMVVVAAAATTATRTAAAGGPPQRLPKARAVRGREVVQSRGRSCSGGEHAGGQEWGEMRVARGRGAAHAVEEETAARGASRRREPSERWSHRRTASGCRTPTPAGCLPTGEPGWRLFSSV